MTSKLEFAERASARDANIAALCREFGITRQTGHKWLKRYRQDGAEGLDDRSRRPKATPLATAEEIVVAIVQAREAVSAAPTPSRGRSPRDALSS